MEICKLDGSETMGNMVMESTTVSRFAAKDIRESGRRLLPVGSFMKDICVTGGVL